MALVISRLYGGLGNQMFQYAAARALSLSHDCALMVDAQDFASYNLHNGYELGRVFKVTVPLASEAHVRHMLGVRGWRPLRKVLLHRQMALVRQPSFVVEPTAEYWPGLAEAPSNCYLVGYWQSERYFERFSSRIRSDFLFRSELDNNSRELLAHSPSQELVSVHVRRGDYVANPKTLSYHGLCSIQYYTEAIRYAVTRVRDPIFVVFSDDIDWVVANIPHDKRFRFVNHNSGYSSYRDMQMMSRCHHHIIANSSFSWWGAWLNPSAAKVVIAPKRWFANQDAPKDVLPNDWVRL